MPQRPRRTREEIIYEILLSLKITRGARITHIMQKTRLNYYQAKNYLTTLEKREYVKEKNGTYIVLAQGREFITRYEALKSLN